MLECLKDRKNKRLLYITGPVLEDGKRSLQTTTKDTLLSWTREFGVNLKVLHSPFLYSVINKEDYLYKLFVRLDDHEQVELKESSQSQATFISLSDLGDLLHKLCERWNDTYESIIIPDPFQLTFGELLQPPAENNNQEKPPEKYAHSGPQFGFATEWRSRHLSQ